MTVATITAKLIRVAIRIACLHGTGVQPQCHGDPRASGKVDRVASCCRVRCRMAVSLRAYIHELYAQLRVAYLRQPRVVAGVVAAALLAAILPIAGGIWFAADLRRGLPDQAAMRRIGEMDQATAVFDATDQLAFTIFKEQRIEVPLDRRCRRT